MARKAPERIETGCVIAGGGPAGVMLGYILARAGVDVTILEKHRDFFRDFRGDTVHPSTLDVLAELGLLEAFLQRPHQDLATVAADIEGRLVTLADFSHLPTHCKFIAFMPQWDFLDLLAEAGRRLPTFHLLMQTEAVGLIETDQGVRGLRARGPRGAIEIAAPLTVAADGRDSNLREKAGLTVRDIGAPMDVLWMRLSRKASDGGPVLGRLHRGRFMVTIDRGDYWQCAFVIRKGGLDEVRAKGLEVMKREIVMAAPMFADRMSEIASWDDLRLLTVTVDRLEDWSRPGLICIGDAAHAMSPVGGVGINLAIQDAVAAANILAGPLRAGRVRLADLQAVQRRRAFPTWATQAMQVFIQKRAIGAFLGKDERVRIPFVFKLLDAIPLLRRFPARFVGVGARPEHVARSLLRTTA
jgi:2-polyprenyl-6-methoxyphenol hydroxylase-like FAD-dependent oxidoreductase